ncbi:MAG TPA: hypothetical protein ENG01_00970 [Candidatus Aenigmarchaeota archaeon]|nr:hypothetical protein [Candidatus Aenigmarchaeota archaeon]HEX32967.1 hypothetical protein [Candidatus Aenigmarchaeota archaeon]
MFRPKEEEKKSVLEYNRYVTKKLGELNERINLLEQKENVLREKVQVVDETIQARIKELRDDIKILRAEVGDIRRTIIKIQDAVRAISKTLENKADVQDVRVIEKNLEMIDPTRFLTEERVKEIIEEMQKE